MRHWVEIMPPSSAGTSTHKEILHASQAQTALEMNVDMPSIQNRPFTLIWPSSSHEPRCCSSIHVSSALNNSYTCLSAACELVFRHGGYWLYRLEAAK